ncbi:hypothetical protein [Chromobacterium sp. IIBBL 290-4]|uniref:hypothetical protein n=1 Tax=Chromobacterium sp. IIBBL 290-4 TaxID=2953890 RepID=UPI0020B8F858|nr:hypothetical protein [Chromobacterium sp. IIBBL 290-4]UTH74973.1 hypothetical protein NKT35_02385 [Chromobacterium sp. IIBBL 290-4]
MMHTIKEENLSFISGGRMDEADRMELRREMSDSGNQGSEPISLPCQTIIGEHISESVPLGVAVVYQGARAGEICATAETGFTAPVCIVAAAKAAYTGYKLIKENSRFQQRMNNNRCNRYLE